MELRHQLQNYFEFLIERTDDQWYEIWHCEQFVAANADLETVYEVASFISEEVLPCPLGLQN